jgi:plasmid maintenance system antidote protein VapI
MDDQLTTVALANRVKALISNETYYGLAKAIGLSRQAVKSWFDRGVVMDDETGIRIAEMLNLDPETVVLWLQVERTERKGNDKLSQVWRHIAEQQAA